MTRFQRKGFERCFFDDFLKVFYEVDKFKCQKFKVYLCLLLISMFMLINEFNPGSLLFMRSHDRDNILMKFFFGICDCGVKFCQRTFWMKCCFEPS